MRKHDWKLFQLVIIGLSLSALLLIQACGVYKNRDEQVLVVEHNSENTTGSSSDGLLDSFKEIYYLLSFIMVSRSNQTS